MQQFTVQNAPAYNARSNRTVSLYLFFGFLFQDEFTVDHVKNQLYSAYGLGSKFKI